MPLCLRAGFKLHLNKVTECGMFAFPQGTVTLPKNSEKYPSLSSLHLNNGTPEITLTKCGLLYFQH